VSKSKLFAVYCIGIGYPALFTWLYGLLRTGLRLRLLDEGRLSTWWQVVTVYACFVVLTLFVTAVWILPRHLRFQSRSFQIYGDCFFTFFLAYLAALLGDGAAREQLAVIGLQWLWTIPMGGLVAWAVFIYWRWGYLARTPGSDEPNMASAPRADASGGPLSH
jgi:hypothetical protein